MCIINKNQNTIEEIQTATFKELGFRERDHSQEWIANNPGCLKEEMLIMQKEFSGFSETGFSGCWFGKPNVFGNDRRNFRRR